MKKSRKYIASALMLFVLFASSGFTILSHICGCEHHQSTHVHESVSCCTSETEAESAETNCCSDVTENENCCEEHSGKCNHDGCSFSASYNNVDLESTILENSNSKKSIKKEEVLTTLDLTNCTTELTKICQVNTAIPVISGKSILITFRNIKIPTPLFA